MQHDSLETTAPRPALTAAVLSIAQIGLFAWFSTLEPALRAKMVPRPDAILRAGEAWRLATGMFAIDGDHWWRAAALLGFLPWFAYHWGRRDSLANCLFGYAFGSVGLLLIWSVAALVWGWRPALNVPAAVSVPATLCLLAGPRQRFALAPRLSVPAWIPVAAYFAAAFAASQPDAVDFAAHLAGALHALLDHQFDGRLSAWAARVRRLVARTKRPAGPVKPSEPIDLTDPNEAAPPAPRGFEARVDELLAKISACGFDSLTAEELRLLQEASQRYRRRGP